MVTESSQRKASSIPALTGIRFWAAIVVVFYHYNLILGYPFPIRLLQEQGRSPVALFFVLSGYILFYNYHGRFKDGVTGWGYWEFARARFARVYPMHAVALGLMTLLVMYLWTAHHTFLLSELNYPIGWRLLLGSWLANLLLVQVYVPLQAFENLWNTPSWSIACEAFAYALFPFFAAGRFLRERSVNFLLGIALLLWGVELALSLGLAFYLETLPAEVRPTLADYVGYRMPPFRIWEFLIGCTMAAAWKRQQELQNSRSLIQFLQTKSGRNLLLALLFGVTMVVALASSVLSGTAREIVSFLQFYTLYTPLFALTILVLGAGGTFLSPLLENRLMTLLGEASYSLYILHWVFMYCLQYAKDYGYPVGPLASPAMIVFTIAISILFYKGVETPMRRVMRGQRS